MPPFQQVLKLALFCGISAAVCPETAVAQRPGPAEWSMRRGVGLRAGSWNVDIAESQNPEATPNVELYLQRSLDSRLVVENSIAIWRVRTTEPVSLPPSSDVEINSYIVPLLISLKFYPIDQTSRAAPFVMGSAGLAFGIEDEGENAIGGGGSSVTTGFGVRWAAGVEFRVIGSFGVSGSARYQWLHFGEPVGSTDTYYGVGVEGGVTYRFQF
jgi:outer membrane protein W